MGALLASERRKRLGNYFLAGGFFATGFFAAGFFFASGLEEVADSAPASSVFPFLAAVAAFPPAAAAAATVAASAVPSLRMRHWSLALVEETQLAGSVPGLAGGRSN